MPKLFINFRRGDLIWGDGTGGVNVRDISVMLPHIQQTVREIIDGEGGPSMEEARVVEVADHRGNVVLVLPFVVAYGVH